jgi:hypothetical protein
MNWKMATLGRRWRERAQYVHLERFVDTPVREMDRQRGDDRTKTPTVYFALTTRNARLWRLTIWVLIID